MATLQELKKQRDDAQQEHLTAHSDWFSGFDPDADSLGYADATEANAAYARDVQPLKDTFDDLDRQLEDQLSEIGDGTADTDDDEGDDSGDAVF